MEKLETLEDLVLSVDKTLDRLIKNQIKQLVIKWIKRNEENIKINFLSSGDYLVSASTILKTLHNVTEEDLK